jgi:hypothetical protein
MFDMLSAPVNGLVYLLYTPNASSIPFAAAAGAG